MKKLTLVSFGKDGKKLSRFMYLPLNKCGKPVLPASKIQKIYDELGIHPGDTISIGI